MLSAEYGGTGGKPIEAGMVVEEPDIEIGAGVSSKGRSSPASLDLRNTLLTPYSDQPTHGYGPRRKAWAAVDPHQPGTGAFPPA